jgi:hypothetical protein
MRVPCVGYSLKNKRNRNVKRSRRRRSLTIFGPAGDETIFGSETGSIEVDNIG